VSTLAATTCSWPCSPAARRQNLVLRGQHRQDARRDSPGRADTATPIADHGQLGARAGGVQEASAAFAHGFGGTGVQRAGVAEFTDHAGRLQPAAACGAKAAAKFWSHPRSASSCG